jgi:hypothetical protein
MPASACFTLQPVSTELPLFENSKWPAFPLREDVKAQFMLLSCSVGQCLPWPAISAGMAQQATLFNVQVAIASSKRETAAELVFWTWRCFSHIETSGICPTLFEPNELFHHDGCCHLLI